MLLQVLFPKGKQPQRMMIGEGSGFFISADGSNQQSRGRTRPVGADHTDAAATHVVPDIFDTC
jgi:hypothetical protein